MNWIHLVMMLVGAALVTPPLVLLFPHARKSAAFDRLLWGSTFAMAFLGAWLAPRYLTLMGDFRIAEIAVAPVLVGAVAGALLLHLLLWMLDLMERPAEEENQDLSDHE